MAWLRDHEGDCWNTEGIDLFYQAQIDGDIWIKIRTKHKDNFLFRGPFSIDSEAKEEMNMIFLDLQTMV